MAPLQRICLLLVKRQKNTTGLVESILLVKSSHEIPWGGCGGGWGGRPLLVFLPEPSRLEKGLWLVFQSLMLSRVLGGRGQEMPADSPHGLTQAEAGALSRTVWSRATRCGAVLGCVAPAAQLEASWIQGGLISYFRGRSAGSACCDVGTAYTKVPGALQLESRMSLCPGPCGLLPAGVWAEQRRRPTSPAWGLAATRAGHPRAACPFCRPFLDGFRLSGAGTWPSAPKQLPESVSVQGWPQSAQAFLSGFVFTCPESFPCGLDVCVICGHCILWMCGSFFLNSRGRMNVQGPGKVPDNPGDAIWF